MIVTDDGYRIFPADKPSEKIIGHILNFEEPLYEKTDDCDFFEIDDEDL